MKKTVAFSALLFSLLLASCGSPTTVTVADFLLAANGVTVLCTAADLGDTGEVGGVTYTKRSKAQIDALVDAGDYASLTTTCTSSVTDMSYMFNFATAFNQDLKGWCVSNITSKPSNFDIGATSWVLPRPVWGTCP